MEPQTETSKTEGWPLGQEIYLLHFYPFQLKVVDPPSVWRAVLGKNEDVVKAQASDLNNRGHPAENAK